MHTDEEQIYRQGGTPVSTRVLDQSDHSVYWKECATCTRIKPFGMFRKDASYREGVRDQCLDCEAAPKLSTQEHIHRLRERNYSAAASQRWGKDQLDFLDESARQVNWMHHSDFIRKVNSIRQCQLYFREGRIADDIAIYRVWDCIVYEDGHFHSKPFDPGHPTFEYVCYLPSGYSPEFSVINFSDLDVPINEKMRGWRTVLLRMIKMGILNAEDVDMVFGTARGAASIPYRRDLYRWRHRN